MGKAGCIPALVALLKSAEETEELSKGCGTALLSLLVETTKYADVMLEVAGLLPAVVAVMQKANSDGIKNLAVHILGALAVGRPDTQTAIAEMEDMGSSSWALGTGSGNGFRPFGPLALLRVMRGQPKILERYCQDESWKLIGLVVSLSQEQKDNTLVRVCLDQILEMVVAASKDNERIATTVFIDSDCLLKWWKPIWDDEDNDLCRSQVGALMLAFADSDEDNKTVINDGDLDVDKLRKEVSELREKRAKSASVGTSGKGAFIVGMDGKLWYGKVEAEDGKYWVLDTGRRASKSEENITWKFEPV